MKGGWEGRKYKKKEREEDKLLLHHVFIRYDLGSSSKAAADITGEESQYL